MLHQIKTAAVLLLLLLPGCLPLTVPTTVPAERSTSMAQPAPAAIEAVKEVRVHPGGGQQAYTPQDGEAQEVAQALLGVFAELNLQALCFYLDDDVARIQSEDRCVELILTQPVDVAIGQRVEASEQDQVPVDERGHRVLRVARVVFILDGEMAGHILAGAGPGEWSCWAVEKNGAIDLGWVESIESPIPPPP